MSALLQSRSEAAFVQRKAPAPVSPIPDIDKDDKTDPLAAADYVGDIISYYRRIEPLYRVAPDYMQKQVHTVVMLAVPIHSPLVMFCTSCQP